LRAALLACVTSHKPAPDYPFPREYRGVYLTRRRECGFQLYDAVGVARGDREASARQAMENYRLFGAPHAMIVTSDEALGVYGVLDCGAWVNNFMLAARSLGVASIAQAALATHPGPLREFFGIGEDRRIVCGMSFGYEDPQHPANQFRTRRAQKEEVAAWIDA
jgi:nitroreductase